MQSDPIRSAPLLALLLRGALLARVLVGALQRLGRREAAQTRRQRRVLLHVDRELEEILCEAPNTHELIVSSRAVVRRLGAICWCDCCETGGIRTEILRSPNGVIGHQKTIY